MKLRFLFSIMLGATLAAGAQGYQDGVDNYNAGRKDIAKEILTNTLNAPSTDKAVSYYYLGCIDFDNKNVAAAKANFDNGIAINPEYPYNYVGLGEVALRSGDKSGAQKLFDQAMKFNKKNTAVIAAVARAYWNVDPVAYKKDIDKWIAKAFKESKNTEPAVYNLQGDMVAKSDPGEAAGLYQMAIDMDKERGNVNREAYVKYARVYNQHNRDLLISMLEELNQLEPESGLAQRELAEVYYTDGKFSRAQKVYEKYVKNPNHFRRDEQRYVAILYTAGSRENDSELFKQAIYWANSVLAQDPNVYQMDRMNMLSYAKLDQDSMALISGDKLFSVSGAEYIPNDYVVYSKLLVDAKRAPEAIALIEKVIAANPDNKDYESLMRNLGEAYAANGEADKAKEAYDNFLRTDAAKPQDCYNMYASLFEAARNATDPAEKAKLFASAKPYIDLANEKAPDFVPYLYQSLLLNYMANGAKINAEGNEIAEKIIDLYKKGDQNASESRVTATYTILIDSLNKDGKTEEAIKKCEEGLQVLPGNANLQETLDRLTAKKK